MTFSFALCTQPLHHLRRAAVVAAVGTLSLLAACGDSSTLNEPFMPSRIIAMGDGLNDAGQVGGLRYTVNDGSVNTWVQQLAVNYGLTLSAQAAGGQNWARGNARVVDKPDAAGNTATLTISEQVDAFLASNSVSENDMVVLDAGISDLVFQAQALKAGSITDAQLQSNLEAAATSFARLARRLADAGAKRIVVTGVIDISNSPFAKALGLTDALKSALQRASASYNNKLIIELSGLQLEGKVLYPAIDSQFAAILASPSTYGLTNVVDAVCTTPATACTPSTIVAGASYNSYLYADDRYLTPSAQRSLGNFVASFLKSRW
jgi:outer membrane lipase/esterase